MQQLSLFDPVEIILTRGYVALVDPIDADLVEFKWSAVTSHDSCTAYAVRGIRRNNVQWKIRLHRIILSRILKRPLAENDLVDHIDLNGLNNQRSNLRLATQPQNARNSPLRKDNKSGFKGVGWSSQHGAWRARIRVDNKRRHLGLFSTAEEAYAAYCVAAREYHGEFARFA